MEIAKTAIPTFPQHDCDDFVLQVCWQKKLMAETVQTRPHRNLSRVMALEAVEFS
jgi:hypothetical protein